MAEVRLKRVYDDASPEDGARVLVDPRGRTRDAAKVDLWITTRRRSGAQLRRARTVKHS
jgi:uncharacterized protein YeaO (DUF488 family)